MVRKQDANENGTPVEIEEISGEIVAAPLDGFDDDALRGIENIDDVISANEVTEISEVLGNGFSVCEDKADLIGVKFVVVKYGVHESDKNGGEFSTIHVVTATGDKLIVNDGSTGIHAQLGELKEKMGRVCPLLVPRGLRVSEYDYEDEKGRTSRARTFYLNTGK